MTMNSVLKPRRIPRGVEAAPVDSVDESRRTASNDRTGVMWSLFRITIGLVTTMIIFAVPLCVFPSRFGLISAAFALLFILGLGVVIAMVDMPTVVASAVSAALLQNTLLGLFHGNDGEVGIVVNEAKTILVAAVALVVFYRHGWRSRGNRWLLAILAVYAVVLVVHNAGFNSSFVANARNFALPIALLVVIALSDPVRDLGGQLYSQWLVGVTAAILLVGSLGELSMGTEAWRHFLHADALPGLNSLSETTVFAGFELSRVGGFLMEPVTAGYVATFVVLHGAIIFMRAVRTRQCTRGIVLFSFFVVVSGFSVIILASTKNSLLMIAAGVVSYVFSCVGWSKLWAFICSIAFGIGATFAYTTAVQGIGYIPAALADPVGASGGESTSIHNAGLLSGIYSLASSPLGHGVGSGGNFYRLYNPDISPRDWLGSGGESAVGTYLYQLGLLAVLFLSVMTFVVLPRLTEEATAVLAAFATASFFAESLFGAPVAIPALFFIGLLCGLAPVRTATTAGKKIFWAGGGGKNDSALRPRSAIRSR
ncbi:hypothetical protein [Corynebacterium anserum]|uniref:O-Antigen ligase n=1 Tax=Corynebacterium anserum TaxID=2684406 RepID=A0A7G7YQK7_9CORY|nr:hypothetical protein [Corynebacterium anserum]QNH96777.1 hypothetical protein GP473_09090 [Corynebacterium anserum]